MKKNNFSVWIYACLICNLFMPCSSLQAADKDAQAPIVRIRDINAMELKQKVDARYPFTLINTMSPIEFKDLSIRESINIPSSQFTKDNPLLPKDLGRMLVLYDKGPKIAKSKLAGDKARDLGYTNIYIYKAGLSDWVRKRFLVTREVKYNKITIPSMTVAEVIQTPLDSLILLDIRGEETKQNDDQIKSAIHIQLDDLEEQYTNLAKDKKIVIIDDAGNQADICGRFLTMKGYTDLAALEGGARALFEHEENTSHDKNADDKESPETH